MLSEIQKVNQAIMFGQFSDNELRSIMDAVKFARTGLQKQNIRSLTLGSTVRWTSDKNPLGVQGTVEKIAIKYVTVKTASGYRWKVPANMLTVV
jgi:small-conductance mechanosensitive channel